MNADHKLNRELAKRIFGNLGAVPNNFGKVGITHKALLSKKPITIAEGSDTKTYPLWAGSIKKASGEYIALLTNLGSSTEPELFLILGTLQDNGELTFASGVTLDWADETDDGSFHLYAQDQWIPMTMPQKLEITLAFELATQEGEQWNQCKSFGNLYDQFISLVELDTGSENE